MCWLNILTFDQQGDYYKVTLGGSFSHSLSGKLLMPSSWTYAACRAMMCSSLWVVNYPVPTAEASLYKSSSTPKLVAFFPLEPCLSGCQLVTHGLIVIMGQAVGGWPGEAPAESNEENIQLMSTLVLFKSIRKLKIRKDCSLPFARVFPPLAWCVCLHSLHGLSKCPCTSEHCSCHVGFVHHLCHKTTK